MTWLFLCAMSILTIQDNEGLTQIPLFISEENGYHTYRIPALAVTPKGTLLAFCEGRKVSGDDSGDIDTLMRRSMDGGRTWEPMQILIDKSNDTWGNPCPVVDRSTGTIWLSVTQNKGNATEPQILSGEAPARTFWMSKSTDDGLTWTEPIDITTQTTLPGWRWLANGPGHGIQLQDGRLLIPCNMSTSTAQADWHSFVIYSDNAGTSWHVGGIEEGQTNESAIVELADGLIYHNMRNYRGTHTRAWSISHDRGLSWTPLAEDKTLIEPVCEAALIRYSTTKNSDRNRILFSNPASTKRENMTIRLSYDECHTWPVAKTLYTGPSAYSDLTVLPDGTIGCLYERGDKNPYETLTLALFSLRWLTDGKDNSIKTITR